MARRLGHEVDVVTPDLRRLDPPPGRQVGQRLEAVLAFDDGFDFVIVHRDAENQSVATGNHEIRTGVGSAGKDLPALPLVPVRMTEAWLLLDEAAIRRVAGRPTSTNPIGLPPAQSVEHVPNPKKTLRSALEAASGVTGRRLQRIRRDFGGQRRRLLEGLDHGGPVSRLSAWTQLEASVKEVLSELEQRSRSPS